MKSLKLNKLNNNRLDKQEMNHLCGGAGCGCSCSYSGQGGSTTDANANANKAKGLYSPNSRWVYGDGGWIYQLSGVVVRP